MGGGGWKGKKIPLKQHSLKCILKYNKGLLFFFSSLLLLLSSFDITSSIVSCLVTLRIHWPALPVLSIIYKEVLLEKKGAEQNEKERTTTIKGLWKCLWNCKTPPKTIAVRNNSMHNLYNSLSRCPASCVILSLYLFFFFISSFLSQVLWCFHYLLLPSSAHLQPSLLISCSAGSCI